MKDDDANSEAEVDPKLRDAVERVLTEREDREWNSYLRVFRILLVVILTFLPFTYSADMWGLPSSAGGAFVGWFIVNLALWLFTLGKRIGFAISTVVALLIYVAAIAGSVWFITRVGDTADLTISASSLLLALVWTPLDVFLWGKRYLRVAGFLLYAIVLAFVGLHAHAVIALHPS